MSRHAQHFRGQCGRPAGRHTPPSHRAALLPLFLLAASAGLAGCSSFSAPTLPALSVPSLSMPRPYTLELQQGIVVDQKMISRLTPGMTRNQVGLTLGTPLLTDVLHGDRWDYVYFTRKKGEVGEWRRFACLFKKDVLVQVTGDVVVAAPGSLPAPDAASAPVAVPPGSSGVPLPLPDAGGPPK